MRTVLVVMLALAGCFRPTVEYFYGYRVGGTVVDADGHPVAGAIVEQVDDAGVAIEDGPGSARARTTTDADGRFVFEWKYIGPADPAATRTWHLVARWRCDGGECPGYDGQIVLRLAAIDRR
jgi:hypothetical protein